MIRAVFVAAALLLLISAPKSLGQTLLPLSATHYATFVSVLTWVLALFLVREINAGLNRWADNKWIWKGDDSNWDWKNEVAIVTGGSNGIGAMVVKKLLSHGIRVAVLDVAPFSDKYQNGNVKYYKCDITSRVQVHEAAETIRSDLGQPSILINNAGIGNANTILEMTPERLRKIFDVNLLSHWITVQEFLPQMILMKKGHIMSTASLAAFVGLAGMTDYACTKAGLMAFHEGLTQELKHRYKCPQIKTSIVYPNWTRTRLTSAIEKDILNSMGSTIMDAKDVADIMVKHIISAKSGQLILGPSIVTIIRALPAWLQEIIRDRMAQIVTVNATTAVA
ncbi:hypothetical protein BCR34DRAFT_284119 [Clohesyomyces aquaticus]|uniref:Short-chain dehydrogenase/reductase 3 n=1 Tax=Clohesyomyces aquaticus TaxID=1231657 RepID=A0A1Y1ZRH9_9PLEO|nr:hypothetical protein BCR34DRAFT_284119 [Clohesyomyces aquaticus]